MGRFAPSPTGAMHLGNARTALLAWLHSRSLGGAHLLRFEDLDVGRVREWAFDCTRRDLEWLGLDWDTEFIQSQRLDLYAQALARLDTYPCTCTRREVLAAIQDSAGAPHGAEPVYPGTCRPGSGRPKLGGTAPGRTEPVNPARPAAIRWRVPDEQVCAHDSWTGETLCQHLAADVGDFVLRRNDGAYAYHLAVVVDDALMGVTDIVRGVDLWPATPRQMALQQALGYPTARYFHVPLLTDYHGERLAKRGGAPPVKDLRERGENPRQVLAQLAQSLGWPVPQEVSAPELIPVWRASLGAELL
ncbi:tRNA glutamyl-Q(34) synthetase GluQRS [Deinococcus fonticola]|uniref:tRNA glutamyl-Q(34) synthetase GluQRS n=1 Tax=Deinococcus fonticola TaxID=2528713 RepID=UPI0023EA5136|nr:tRNA glutamyl-Q(34) synthetase GluQRS [Deinococcus fonticola]